MDGQTWKIKYAVPRVAVFAPRADHFIQLAGNLQITASPAVSG